MTRSSLLYVSAVLTLSLVRPPNVVEYALPRPKAFPHDPAVGAVAALLELPGKELSDGDLARLRALVRQARREGR